MKIDPRMASGQTIGDAAMNPADIAIEAPNVLLPPWIGQKFDVFDGLLQFIKGGRSAIEKRTAIDRGLDALRLRSRSRTPKVCSRSEIAFETTGLETESVSAAFAMLPLCTTVRRIFTSRSLSRRPIRSSQSIPGALAKQLIRCRK